MASPHVAGVLALLKQAAPRATTAQLRKALQTTATPLALSGDPALGLSPVAHQGTGRINALAALKQIRREKSVRASLSPAKISLRDMEGRSRVVGVTVKNTSSTRRTFVLRHTAAISAAPPYTDYWLRKKAAAKVSFLGGNRVVLKPGRSTTVQVRIQQATGVAQGTLLGGWIEARVKNQSRVQSRTTYLGMVGDYDAVGVINPTFSDVNPPLDNPALRPGEWYFGRNEPLTVDLGDEDTSNDTAAVNFSHGYPLSRRMRVEVLDEQNARVRTIDDQRWLYRNSGAGTGVDWWVLDMTDDSGAVVPPGRYRIRFTFDKVLGDPDGAPPSESWTSPTITLAG